MVMKGVKRKSRQEELELPAEPIKVEPLKSEDNNGETSQENGFMPLEIPLLPISGSTKKKLKTSKLRKKKADVNKDEKTDSSVIYVGRIPHGFYENQMRGYFGQFGTVNKIRLSRNKKTGKSKGYAFIEFESSEVAKIVAECMNNYLLSGKLLQVYVVPNEKIHPKLFVGANKKFRVINRRAIEIRKRKQAKTLQEQQQSISNILKEEQKRRKKISEQGIDYEFDGYKSMVPPKPKHVKF